MHARIENSSIVEWPIVDLRQRLPDSSLPENLTDSSKLPDGFVWVESLVPAPYDPLTHKLMPFGPRQDGGRWVCGYEPTPLSPEEAATVLAQREETVRQQRAEAYRQESDPLFFKSQRGEATSEEWMAKIAEIKARYPMPSSG